MQCTIEIHRGEDALRLIGTSAFREQLRKLHAACPWSTVFQSFPFLDAWYFHYDAPCEPLIVAGFDEQRNLVGLVPLAVERDSGNLVVAGRQYAEYQVWLSMPELRTDFIETALESLRKAFPRRRLQFGFLRPDVPLESFRSGGAWSGSCEIRTFPRPLMAVGDANRFRESLSKKSNKSRLNRLEKLGALQFRHVERFEELEGEFNEIVTFSDFRKGAVYGKLPFRDDPFKKPFYLSLLRTPGLMHVSVLRLNGKIISAHIGAKDRDQVMLGIITHSPFLSEHSPGKLHILFLGINLAEEGFRELDLTPGGNYKDRFATHHDEAFVLTIFFNSADRLLHDTKRRVSGIGKKVLDRPLPRMGPMREALRRIHRNALPSRMLAGIRGAGFRTRETRLYEAALSDFTNLASPSIMNRDDLDDLMSFDATDAENATVHDFVRGALARFEAGHHVYTSAVNRVLAYSGWLAGPQKTVALDEVGHQWLVPPGAVAFYGLYAHRDYRRNEFLYGALIQMLRDAAAMAGARQAYIFVPAGDNLISQVVQRLGFRHAASFFQKKALRGVIRWSTPDRSERDGLPAVHTPHPTDSPQ